MPQERLAADADVDRAHVSDIERKVANPTIDFLDGLAKTLGVPLSEFFKVPGPGAKPPRSLQVGRKRATKHK